MQGVPVGQTCSLGRVFAALVVCLIIYVTSSSSQSQRTTAPTIATSSELQVARAELVQRSDELRLRQSELEAAKQELARLKRQLDDVQAAHAKAHAATPAPTSGTHHNHEGMKVDDPTRDVLHPVVGRNEHNKWSEMKLNRAEVRNFARVSDAHMCRAHTFHSFFNESDPLCTLGTLLTHSAGQCLVSLHPLQTSLRTSPRYRSTSPSTASSSRYSTLFQTVRRCWRARYATSRRATHASRSSLLSALLKHRCQRSLRPLRAIRRKRALPSSSWRTVRTF